MKTVCDYCDLVFDDWKLEYYEGFQLCEYCKGVWERGEQIEKVEPTEDYEPNPDFGESEDGECEKCPD